MSTESSLLSAGDRRRRLWGVRARRRGTANGPDASTSSSPSYVGKGTNLNTYSVGDLCKIELRINTTPRRSLAWDTGHDRYHAAVAMTG